MGLKVHVVAATFSKRQALSGQEVRSKNVRIRGNTARLCRADAVEFLENLKPASVDLLLSSPPYCIGKEYDRHTTAEEFTSEHIRIVRAALKALKEGGSICWQVGNFVSDNEVVPLDSLIYSVARYYPELKLRNRIIWSFNHGAHSARRLSGRHETVLWFTKGDTYRFDLDAIRVRQKYPGKKHYKGPRRGQWSGNPRGKNPGDVWEIPNVNSNHVEKTKHPCQFPVALASRLIRALTDRDGLVVDPYMGSATTAVGALMNRRDFAGSDIKADYVTMARRRLEDLKGGRLKVREDAPPRAPVASQAVAKLPPHFKAR